MTTRTHTYSDGSQIELGSEPGKGWIAVLKDRHLASEEEAAQRKRTITGRKAIRVQPQDTTRPDRDF